jgi:hypothetical protein
MEHDKQLRNVESISGFKEVMSNSKDYSQHEYYKVDQAYQHFLEEVILHIAKPEPAYKLDYIFG